MKVFLWKRDYEDGSWDSLYLVVASSQEEALELCQKDAPDDEEWHLEEVDLTVHQIIPLED